MLEASRAVRRAIWGFLLLSALACLPRAAPPPGVLRINLGTEPPTLDWTRATDSVSIQVIDQLMRGLTQLGPDLQPVPALAERWHVTPDGRVYTFYLRHGVRWTDGEPLRAEHFVYAWRRLLDPQTAAEYAYFLFPVRGARAYNAGELLDPNTIGVRALDDRTLRVELEGPLVYFPSITTFMVTYPARRDVIEAYGERWTEPAHIVTLGPFRLEAWEHEYRILLRPNPDYFAGPPRLGQIAAYMVTEGSTALILFEQGILDIVRVPPLEIRRLSNHPGYRRIPALRGYYYGFNTEEPPFDDPRVRRAFGMAIDRRELPKVLRGGELPASFWIPPGMPHHNPGIGLRFDAEAARRLLREAGIDPEELTPIRVVYNTDQTHRLVAQNIQKQWQTNLGVRVELESREWKVFLKELVVKPSPVYRLGWGADFPDPDNFMSLFTSYSANNHTRWGSPRYDRLVQQAARARDPSRRQELYDEAQRILCEREAPIIPLFVSAINLLVSERVRGFEPNPMDLVFFDGVETH
jgi:oligopeptide transport system substrate-binding protein